MRTASSAADERELHLTDRLDEVTWRRFVNTHPSGNVFHTPEMYQVFAQARHHRPRLWAATDRSGSPLALLPPVEITLWPGPLRSWTSRAVAYGGLLTSEDPAGTRAMGTLLATYGRAFRRGPLFTELRHLSDASAVEGVLRDAGFSHEGHLNYLVDLSQSEDALWSALSKTARQRVRSGQRKGVGVQEITSPQGVDEAYRVLTQVYSHTGIPLADPSLFRAALSILHPRGMFRIFTVQLGGQIIGTRYLLTHKERIIDWYAGADRAFASYSPNEILVWHVLRWGKEQGFRTFDFGGAGRPNEPYGPREFKSKFGGQLVDYGRHTLVHRPTRMRLAQAGYELARGALWHRPQTRRGADAWIVHPAPSS